MNAIFAFILPSVLGLKLFMHFNKNKKMFDLIIYYLLFILFSNLVVMIIVNITHGGVQNIFEYLNSDLLVTINYTINALIINILLSIIFTVIDKYIVFDIEVENERKKKKISKNM